MKIDLHMHSIHSIDGEFESSELVRQAAGAGLDCIAVTDHNCASGVAEAVRAGREYGVEVIPGIEMDCTFKDLEVHLLGYFIQPEDPRYLALCADVKAQERALAKTRTELVRGLGLFIDQDELERHSEDGIVTGELLGELALADPRNNGNPLLEPYRPGGSRSENATVSFYWDICAPGKPAFVEIRYQSLEEGVALVRESGGVPILAHPSVNLTGREDELPNILACGVKGLEAYCSYHNPEQAAWWRARAEEQGVIFTCGSDYHGKIKPAVSLGGHGGELWAEDVYRNLQNLR